MYSVNSYLNLFQPKHHVRKKEPQHTFTQRKRTTARTGNMTQFSSWEQEEGEQDRDTVLPHTRTYIHTHIHKLLWEKLTC